MPLMKCSKGGKSGWKYGESGYCYTGPQARANALQQARAMYANGYRGDSVKDMVSVYTELAIIEREKNKKE